MTISEASRYWTDQSVRPAAGSIRRDFPILRRSINGHPLVWLDNAATTQKPAHVIDTLAQYYSTTNSNVHRGAHTLARRATQAYEDARQAVARFLGARSASEIVFTRGTTEAINLVAQTYGRQVVDEGDEIVLTMLEHHSNIVPWQLLAEEKNARLRVVPLDDAGDVIMDEYAAMLGPRTRIVALGHVSNVLGTVLPIREMALLAHQHGARVLVDGAQAAAHLPIDVTSLGVDFYAISGHKLFAPTGIGALYGVRELLDGMPPWQGGGNMIKDVTFERTSYADPPQRFEAGTGNIADAVGLHAAIDYLDSIGFPAVLAGEEALFRYADAALAEVPGLRRVGSAHHRAGVLTFVMGGLDPDKVARRLDACGIAVRSGHHCAQPTLRRYGLESAVRASLAVYNTYEDVDALTNALSNLARRSASGQEAYDPSILLSRRTPALPSPVSWKPRTDSLSLSESSSR